MQHYDSVKERECVIDINFNTFFIFKKSQIGLKSRHRYDVMDGKGLQDLWTLLIESV